MLYLMYLGIFVLIFSDLNFLLVDFVQHSTKKENLTQKRGVKVERWKTAEIGRNLSRNRSS